MTSSSSSSSSSLTSLLETASQWASMDPNPTTSTYILNLIHTIRTTTNPQCPTSISTLQSLFSSRISFGTAGLRSKFQPGPSGMNDLIIIQTTQGLAKYVQSHHNTTALKAVVGYDHRTSSKWNLSSLQFAKLCKLVFEKAGMECTLLDGYVPTPLVSFAVIEIGAAVGVMITASHNPKDDDGYKVYWNDGCQIRSPMDDGIQRSIHKKLTPWMDYGIVMEHESPQGDLKGNPFETERIAKSYYRKMIETGLVRHIVSENCSSSDNEQRRRLPKMAYTAMHGVSLEWARRSFLAFGLPPFLEVPNQVQPNAEFPTVSFPNPEEDGALQLGMDFALERHCEVLFANDPDGDRLAVAEWDEEEKEWVVFEGNQIGVMLGCWMWDSIGKDCDRPVAMVTSAVSSRMLARIASIENFHSEEALTGFKNIGATSLRLQTQGYRVLLTYEEAIGFCCGQIIPDKDGISALGVFAELACHLYLKGMTIRRYLMELYAKYGEFVCRNGYYTCCDPEIITRILEGIRNNGTYLECVGDYRIRSIRDLGVPGYDSTTSDRKPTLPTDSISPLLSLTFENGCVAHFRASGTEPKFKYYIEMAGKVGVEREVVKRELEEMVMVLLEELLKPKENGLMDPPKSSL